MMLPVAPERFRAWLAPKVTPPLAVTRAEKVWVGVKVLDTEV